MRDVRDFRAGLVVRPSRGAGLAVLAVAAVAGAALTAAAASGAAPAFFAVAVGAAFAAMTAAGTVALYRARITLTGDEITVRGAFSTRRRNRSRVTHAVRAVITAPRGASSESLFLLGGDGGLVIRVPSGAYARADIDRLLDALGVPCGGPGRPVDPRRFAETYPGLLPWAERHPYRLAFAITGAVAAAVLVLVGAASL
ncbi:hypothetical protein GCM10027440_13000 [Nocardiopsis coralliicola]